MRAASRRAAHNKQKGTRREYSTHARGRIRLRDRRRGHRGLRAREPPDRGSRHQRAAAGSGRQGRLPLDSYPGRLSVLHRQPAHRLAVQDAARSGAQRPRAVVSARPRARRLLVDQRDDLHARPARGLRPLGAGNRRRRLVVGQRAADLQAQRGSPCGRERRARRGRLLARRETAAALGDPRIVRAGRAADGHSRDRRFQPRRQCRGRLLRSEPEARRALEYVEGVPAAGDGAPEPDRDHRRACAARDFRRSARGRRRVSRRRHRLRRARERKCC